MKKKKKLLLNNDCFRLSVQIIKIKEKNGKNGQ